MSSEPRRAVDRRIREMLEEAFRATQAAVRAVDDVPGGCLGAPAGATVSEAAEHLNQAVLRLGEALAQTFPSTSGPPET